MYYKRITDPSIWGEMEKFQRDFNQLFDETLRGYNQAALDYPVIAMWTNVDSAIVTAEIPGVSPEDLSLNINKQILVLSGERHPEETPKSAEYHRQERTYGKFNRTIELPFPVNAEAVQAKLDKGILTVILPRQEADKPRKITVKSSN